MTRQESIRRISPKGTFAALWSRYEWAIDNGYPATPTALSLYRVGLALYILIARPVPHLRWMAQYPDEFYSPPAGLPEIWRGVLPEVVLVGFELAVLALVVLLLIGWRTPWVSLAVGISGILINSIYFSFGKIDHTIVLWLVPIVFSFSGWGAALSYDATTGRAHRGTPTSGSRAIFTTGVLLAVSFLTAGIPKLLGGWLAVEESATRLHVLLFARQLDRNHYLADFAVGIESRWFWEALDWGTVVFELVMGVALLWPVFQRRMILVAWLFHLSVLLVMNIGFIGPLPVYPVFFLPLLTEERARHYATRITGRVSAPVMLTGAVVLFSVAAIFGGLWPAVASGVLGMSDLTRDLIFLSAGLVMLAIIAARTGGYRSQGIPADAVTPGAPEALAARRGER